MVETNIIIQGDCIEQMKLLPENSVDAIITDPPYGLEFMGKEWDKFGAKLGDITERWDKEGKTIPSNRVTFNKGIESMNTLQSFCNEWAKECIRILKPGGFLLSFGGTRTYHRLVCGIEDAGFEIRDTIMWLYGSGFPKSLNVGKQIDKIQGNEREVIGKRDYTSPDFSDKQYVKQGSMMQTHIKSQRIQTYETKGSSEWEGWGTALKPACEPIVVARKPLSEKNVALNVLKWGTGGINIDECRIGIDNEQLDLCKRKVSGFNDKYVGGSISSGKLSDYSPMESAMKYGGRFPANIIFDEEAEKMLDEQSGESKSISAEMPLPKGPFSGITNQTYDIGISTIREHIDKGGASRFFYTAKTSSGERNYGCGELDDKEMNMYADEGGVMQMGGASLKGNHKQVQSKKNIHPTVKPIKLMEYLIKLVTKERAIVLDPFLGSGTTAIACLNLNRKFIGMEKEEEYVKIAEKRIKFWEKPKERRETEITKYKIIEHAKQNKDQKTLW